MLYRMQFQRCTGCGSDNGVKQTSVTALFFNNVTLVTEVTVEKYHRRDTLRCVVFNAVLPL